jgi:hypothetical protein
VSELLKRLGIPESKQQTVSKIIQDKESDVLELPAGNESQENDLDDESKPYVQRRLRGQEISLELVKLRGERRAPEYAYLMDKLIDETAEEIILLFTTCTVTIRGRNLLPLFRGVKDHIVALIREANPLYEVSSQPVTFIGEIIIEDKTGEGF